MSAAPRRRPWGWIAAQLLFVAAVVLALRFEWPVPDGAQTIERAQVDAVPVRLPDDWRMRGVPARAQHYLVELDLAAAPAAPQAILLGSVRMNAAVRVNGERVDAPVPADWRGWMRPLLVPVPASLLHPGRNRIELAVHADAEGRGYLGAPLIGSASALAAQAALRGFVQQTLVQLNIGMTVVVALLMLLLWSLRRHDSVYALYGLGMLLWALHNLNFVVAAPPMPVQWWEAMSYVLLGGFVAFATRFILRYLGTPWPNLERAVGIAVAVGATLFLVLPQPAARTYGDLVWNPAVMSVGLALCLHTHACAWRRADPQLHALAASGSLIVALGTHDLLISLGLRPWGGGYLLHHAAIVSLVVFTALLMVRFARGLAAVERMNDELNLRVDAALREAGDAQQRLQALERGRWLAAERERIARDIHDGVGGHLVALLARARTGRLGLAETEAALSHAMEDLRLAIDSLEADEGDLPTALAKFRHRLERRLRDTPVRLAWQAGDAPNLAGYGPAEILQVLRILDEAATNVLRHAQASEITIGYGGSTDTWEIRLADNGVGGANAASLGHGLRNMEVRAAALGASVRVDSAAHGTTLVLRMPARRG